MVGESQPTIIAVANQKGGVAKTTTSVNLTALLAAAGKRVLLVDMDPQGGCAVCLGMDTTTMERSIYDALVKQDVGVADVVVPTAFAFDLAPANIDLAGAEIELKQALAAETVLQRKLKLANKTVPYPICSRCRHHRVNFLTVFPNTQATATLFQVHLHHPKF